jgi:hypothetical protein
VRRNVLELVERVRERRRRLVRGRRRGLESAQQQHVPRHALHRHDEEARNVQARLALRLEQPLVEARVAAQLAEALDGGRVRVEVQSVHFQKVCVLEQNLGHVRVLFRGELLQHDLVEAQNRLDVGEYARDLLFRYAQRRRALAAQRAQEKLHHLANRVHIRLLRAYQLASQQPALCLELG